MSLLVQIHIHVHAGMISQSPILSFILINQLQGS